MSDNFRKIQLTYLRELYSHLPEDLEQSLPAIREKDVFHFKADEEFPASVTCLFATNAELFLPVDGLADVGEYTAKKIIEIVTS